MPTLLESQERADELRPQLYGTWKDVNTVSKPEDEEGPNYRATETRIYTFGKDGSFAGVEEKHGQSSPYLKEDWKFISNGTFDLMGDSICMFVKHEKCVQQMYTRYYTDVKKWKPEPKPTYDSTFATPKKDIITWSDLKIEFKYSKK
jgi:hypothetical protein